MLAQQEEVWFQPNKGQWDSRILYKVSLVKGDFFIEKDKFTYALSDLGDVYHAAHEGKEVDQVNHHTIHSHFINSSWQGEVNETDSSTFYKNYFLGSDSTKWKSKVRSYKTLEFIDFYPGIDMILESSPEDIKYSFRVSPGTDPAVIKIHHDGMASLEVEKEQVEIKTRFGSIFEKNLQVWNALETGEKVAVDASFSLNQDTVTYLFPNGYDEHTSLIIDPSLTFSTFTGSTSDNWGFTAAPDDDGNLYAGGIVFGTGYPISTGAYDATFNGGHSFYKIDMGISKFSSDGSSLLYSTYIGGDGNETPNSIITNGQDELYILGISASPNFPVSASAYQTMNNGGVITNQISIQFNGTDMVVSKLSADGTALLSSTYLGGSENDGLNVSSLNYNYGDVFRGEIILDLNGDVLITSSTQSPDFPIVNGSSTVLGGSQDAIVAKMTPDLSGLIWSTFLGGNQDDAGYSIQVSSTNNIFVSGGTKSTGLPFAGGHTATFQGGAADGFIAELNGTTSAVLNGSYIGTNNYDQSFFVQLDLSDRVYVFGQTAGAMPVTPGVYSNPNSGQFIRQYSPDLSTLNWSTIVGGGNGVVEISPTAFLVSNCNEIYYTGWGGQTNRTVQATGSTSNGFPTTIDAYQSSTNGNNFYVGVLAENATALNYGTYMGGLASSNNHVDGGTSRFDKHGRIYHAVCGACGGNNNGFTTTPGAFSETNNSSNCNLAAWKFDLGAIYSATSVPSSYICLPDSAFFSNDSQNGSAYFWDFGDGTTSTAFEPDHFYPNPGTYDVMFVVSDVDGCFDPDTSYLTIEIGDFNGAIVQPPSAVCPESPYQLEASGGIFYEWTPAQGLDDPTSPTPIATVDTTTIFTVIVSDSCGSDTLSLTLEVFQGSSESIADLEICKGDTVQLWVNGGVDYSWSATDPDAIIGPSTEDTLMVAPENDMDFTAEIFTSEGCTLTEVISIVVFQDVPFPIVEDTSNVCLGESININVSGAPIITWSPNTDINLITGPNVTISTTEDRWYFIDFTNACGTVPDSIFIDVKEVFPLAGNDTIVCPRERVNLWASGGVQYEWSPSSSVASPSDSVTTASPLIPTLYTVLVTDKDGCSATAEVNISHFPSPFLQLSADYYGFTGDEVPLYASANSAGGTYTWSPTEYLSCVNCPNPIATPPRSTVYTVTFEDENGCDISDQVAIKYEALIYVPNTFTPDNSGNNDIFIVEGGNIIDFEIMIFNRWGEVVYQSVDMKEGWDGTYNGEISPDGTYVWKIIYEDTEFIRQEIVGHVNLLR